MLTERLVGGGAERVAVELAGAAALRGHPTTLVATHQREGGDVARQLELAGVHVHLVGGDGQQNWPALVRRTGWRRFDILHAHVHGSNCRGALLSRMAGIPIFIATEHSWRYRGRLRRRLRDRYLVAPLADAFVAVSEADRQALIHRERIPSQRLHVIPNGVPLSREPRSAAPGLLVRLQEIRARAYPLVGTVCYLRRQKGLHTLIRATTLLRRSIPSAELAIVGDGPLADELRNVAGSLGADRYVHFLGHSDAPRALLSHFDIFAMSSEFEGMPLALLEAMAEGKTIVATSVGAIPEMAPDGQAALLVEPGRPRDLAAALHQVATDRGLARYLGLNASARARTYSWEVSAERWFALYDSLWTACRRSGASGT